MTRRSVSQQPRRLGPAAAVIALIADSPKPTIVVATTPAARQAGQKAGALVAVGAGALGGRGGGKDDMAQGGGTDASQIDAAIAAIAQAIG